MNLKEIKIPTSTSDVQKEECALCFETCKSKNGIYICMNSFQGYCSKHIVDYYNKTGKKCFLNFRQTVQEKKIEDTEKKPLPKKLGIGIDGGFDFEGTMDYLDHWAFFV